MRAQAAHLPPPRSHAAAWPSPRPRASRVPRAAGAASGWAGEGGAGRGGRGWGGLGGAGGADTRFVSRLAVVLGNRWGRYLARTLRSSSAGASDADTAMLEEGSPCSDSALGSWPRLARECGLPAVSAQLSSGMEATACSACLCASDGECRGRTCLWEGSGDRCRESERAASHTAARHRLGTPRPRGLSPKRPAPARLAISQRCIAGQELLTQGGLCLLALGCGARYAALPRVVSPQQAPELRQEAIQRPVRGSRNLHRVYRRAGCGQVRAIKGWRGRPDEAAPGSRQPASGSRRCTAPLTACRTD